MRFGDGLHQGLDNEMQVKIREFDERFHLLDAIKNNESGLIARIRDMEERFQNFNRPIIVQQQQQVSSRIADSIIAPENLRGMPVSKTLNSTNRS